MARPILDTVVQRNIQSASAYLDVMSNIMYTGSVSTDKPKITLEEAKFGLNVESIISPLENKYMAIQLEEDGVIVIREGEEEKTLPATKEQLTMLKALAVEQVSLCDEYSAIVADLFWQLFYKVAFKKGVNEPFKMPVDASRLRTVVTSNYSDYITRKVLGGNE